MILNTYSKDTIILQHLVEDSWGSIYLKWAYDNKFKLKTNNYGFKRIQNLIKFVANSGELQKLN
jgi:hypothetical protein